jgi:hypothetical protein
VSHGDEGLPSRCFFCDRPAHPDGRTTSSSLEPHMIVCPECRGRPCHVLIAGPAPVQGPADRFDRPRRPANPQLLADALVELRAFVIDRFDDEDPEVVQRPRYLTSSSTPTEKK